MVKANIPEKGAIIQRDMETYSISPHIPGGFIEPAIGATIERVGFDTFVKAVT